METKETTDEENLDELFGEEKQEQEQDEEEVAITRLSFKPENNLSLHLFKLPSYIKTDEDTLTSMKTRRVLDETLNPITQTNTRLIEWEDGSMTLAIGDLQFEMIAGSVDGKTVAYHKHQRTACMESLFPVKQRWNIRPNFALLKTQSKEEIDVVTGERLASGRAQSKVKLTTQAEGTDLSTLSQIDKAKQRGKKKTVPSRKLTKAFLEEDREFIDDTELFGDDLSEGEIQ